MTFLDTNVLVYSIDGKNRKNRLSREKSSSLRYAAAVF